MQRIVQHDNGCTRWYILIQRSKEAIQESYNTPLPIGSMHGIFSCIYLKIEANVRR